MPRPEKITIDVVGKKFGRLTIMEKLGKIKGQQRKVRCMCDCGKQKDLNVYNVLSGITKSCGCLFVEVSTKVKTKHGLGNHPLAKIWSNMIARCYDVRFVSYKDYGANGVLVCDLWKNDFFSFFAWAMSNGWKKELQLDKDKLSPYKTGIIYSPDFCCFLTRKENSWHRKTSVIVEYKNEKKCLDEWTTELGLDWQLMRNRIFVSNWSVEKAFETKIRRMKTNKILQK